MLSPSKKLRQSLCFYFSFICFYSYSQSASIPGSSERFVETEVSASDRLLFSLVKQIDSVSHTNSMASHFAKIYTASMGNINVQLQGLDSGAQAFVKKFETSFISYFLEANTEFNRGELPTESVWSFYFSHPEAEPWQLTLIGVNAHINGDIWKGLVSNFSATEIDRYKKTLLSFQSSISKAFQPFFEELIEQSAYLKFVNAFTKGTARYYGEWLIYNWRLRQINLAMTYSTDPRKFKERFTAIHRKKDKIDRLILRNKKIAMF
jgi:uncharacterized protein DUF5995